MDNKSSLHKHAILSMFILSHTYQHKGHMNNIYLDNMVAQWLQLKFLFISGYALHSRTANIACRATKNWTAKQNHRTHMKRSGKKKTWQQEGLEFDSRTGQVFLCAVCMFSLRLQVSSSCSGLNKIKMTFSTQLRYNIMFLLFTDGLGLSWLKSEVSL